MRPTAATTNVWMAEAPLFGSPWSSSSASSACWIGTKSLCCGRTSSRTSSSTRLAAFSPFLVHSSSFGWSKPFSSSSRHCQQQQQRYRPGSYGGSRAHADAGMSYYFSSTSFSYLQSSLSSSSSSSTSLAATTTTSTSSSSSSEADKMTTTTNTSSNRSKAKTTTKMKSSPKSKTSKTNSIQPLEKTSPKRTSSSSTSSTSPLTSSSSSSLSSSSLLSISSPLMGVIAAAAPATKGRRTKAATIQRTAPTRPIMTTSASAAPKKTKKKKTKNAKNHTTSTLLLDQVEEEQAQEILILPPTITTKNKMSTKNKSPSLALSSDLSSSSSSSSSSDAPLDLQQQEQQQQLEPKQPNAVQQAPAKDLMTELPTTTGSTNTKIDDTTNGDSISTTSLQDDLSSLLSDDERNENDAPFLLNPRDLLLTGSKSNKGANGTTATTTNTTAIPLPKSLSPSSIIEFQGCPQSFLFQYILGLKQPTTKAMAKGTLIHSTLEQIFDLDPAERTLETLQNLFRANWKACRDNNNTTTDHQKNDSYSNLFVDAETGEWQLEAERAWGQHALQLLQNYYDKDRPQDQGRGPAHRERWVMAHLSTHPPQNLGASTASTKDGENDTILVRGIMDRLELIRQDSNYNNPTPHNSVLWGRPNHFNNIIINNNIKNRQPKEPAVVLRLCDYKTGKAPEFKYAPWMNEKIRQQAFFQLQLYALLMRTQQLSKATAAATTTTTTTTNKKEQQQQEIGDHDDDEDDNNSLIMHQPLIEQSASETVSSTESPLPTMDLRYLRLFYLTRHPTSTNNENYHATAGDNNIDAADDEAVFLDWDLGATQPERDAQLLQVHQQVANIWQEIQHLCQVGDFTAWKGCDRSFCYCHKCRPRFVPGTVWEPFSPKRSLSSIVSSTSTSTLAVTHRTAPQAQTFETNIKVASPPPAPQLSAAAAAPPPPSDATSMTLAPEVTKTTSRENATSSSSSTATTVSATTTKRKTSTRKPKETKPKAKTKAKSTPQESLSSDPPPPENTAPDAVKPSSTCDTKMSRPRTRKHAKEV
ncbi:hypothetical protein ACA910_008010 [Epithemia clementina (nom. ined.)]